jgi:hypothetical protein
MKRLAVSAATLALAGSALVFSAGPSSAVTQHCPDHQTADKVELSGDVRTLTFAPGTVVCFKAGTVATTVTVGEDGVLASPKGISYYIVIDEPPYGS